MMKHKASPAWSRPRRGPLGMRVSLMVGAIGGVRFSGHSAKGRTHRALPLGIALSGHPTNGPVEEKANI